MGGLDRSLRSWNEFINLNEPGKKTLMTIDSLIGNSLNVKFLIDVRPLLHEQISFELFLFVWKRKSWFFISNVINKFVCLVIWFFFCFHFVCFIFICVVQNVYWSKDLGKSAFNITVQSLCYLYVCTMHTHIHINRWKQILNVLLSDIYMCLEQSLELCAFVSFRGNFLSTSMRPNVCDTKGASYAFKFAQQHFFQTFNGCCWCVYSLIHICTTAHAHSNTYYSS